MDGTQYFKLLVTIKKQPNDEAVHFKVDGGRFETERTLKLNVNSKYSVELTFRPAKTLGSLNIEGGNMCTETKKLTEDVAVYVADWVTTGLDLNKKGNRHIVPIVLEINDLGSMKINLQCKFYPETEKDHCHWGTPVSHIEYECKVPEGCSYIDIVKETFR